MFFRFAAALMLVVLTSMLGIQLEQQTLRLRRTVSRQYYQTDLLLEWHAQLRLRTQRLTAPAQLASLTAPEPHAGPRHRIGQDAQTADPSAERFRRVPLLPLLRFQRPFDPEGIDR